MSFFFFFNDTATTEIYTLSLHDALPISPADGAHAVHLFGDLNAAAGEHELYARLAGAARGFARRLRCVGAAVQRRGSGRPARPGAHRKCLALTRRAGRDPGGRASAGALKRVAGFRGLLGAFA